MKYCDALAICGLLPEVTHDTIEYNGHSPSACLNNHPDRRTSISATGSENSNCQRNS